MYFLIYLYAFVALTFRITCNAKELPPFLHVCKRDSPDIKACIIQSVEELRPYLQKGVPEYNIPSVEPIIIKDLIKEESGGIKITTTDVVAHGGGDYIVQDVALDMETRECEVDILLPKLTIEAKYTVEGKLLLVPLNGKGNFFGNLTDCSAKSFLRSETYEVDGEPHFKFVSNEMKIKVGGGHVRLDNLFSTDTTLNNIMNDSINKNLGVFLKELLPYIERALAANLLVTGNKIIEPYSINQLFP